MTTMRSRVLLGLAGLAAAWLATVAGAGQARPVRASVGRLMIEARRLEGEVGGPTEFAGAVKLWAPELTVTCERLQVWPTPTGRDVERAEAEGEVVVRRRHVDAEGVSWDLAARAERAAYDAKAATGVLEGTVELRATNAATGARLTIAADRVTYDMRTRRFRSEQVRSPVRVQWEEPEAGAGGGESQP